MFDRKPFLPFYWVNVKTFKGKKNKKKKKKKHAATTILDSNLESVCVLFTFLTPSKPETPLMDFRYRSRFRICVIDRCVLRMFKVDLLYFAIIKLSIISREWKIE